MIKQQRDLTKQQKQNNPAGVVSGETVILDKEFNNSSEVTIALLTPQHMYATVFADGEKWDVMTRRLTKKTKDDA